MSTVNFCVSVSIRSPYKERNTSTLPLHCLSILVYVFGTKRCSPDQGTACGTTRPAPGLKIGPIRHNLPTGRIINLFTELQWSVDMVIIYSLVRNVHNQQVSVIVVNKRTCLTSRFFIYCDLLSRYFSLKQLMRQHLLRVKYRLFH